MRTVVIVALAFLSLPKPGFGQPPPEQEDRRALFMRMMMTRGRSRSGIIQPIERMPKPRTFTWRIPAGEFGLLLKDKTRMIGRPTADDVIFFKTARGMLAFKASEIHNISPGSDGLKMIVHKNGKHDQGKLIGGRLRFRTKFGTLKIPATSIARMCKAEMTFVVWKPESASVQATANAWSMYIRLNSYDRSRFRAIDKSRTLGTANDLRHFDP